MKSWWKWALSYMKVNWNFDDYPLETWKNPNAGERKVAYGAAFRNWSTMVEHGNTAEEAVATLKEKFAEYKKNNEIPRPGTFVPIKFASSKIIDQYADVAEDFLRKIFGLKYSETFISDGSSLDLFARMNVSEDEFREETISRVKKVYSVDISDVYDQALWKVFDKLRQSKVTLG